MGVTEETLKDPDVIPVSFSNNASDLKLGKTNNNNLSFTLQK